MGSNSVCCHDNRPSLQQSEQVETIEPLHAALHPPPPIDHSPSPHQILPTWLMEIISAYIKSGLGQGKFEEELRKMQQAKQHIVEGEKYFGQLDEKQQPFGFGAICKSNGHYYVGHFQNGKAKGFGFYFFGQHSYYRGDMLDNKAHSNDGYFKDEKVQYQGGFEANEFNGLGHEKGKNYEFNGYFQMGKWKQGELKWTEKEVDYIYKGPFDSNSKFTGKGRLSDALGAYEGEFLGGNKHGYGVYRFKTDNRYEGYYKDNLKQGRGQLVNKNGTIAFAGEFIQGIPAGKGYATDIKGNKFSLFWNEAEYSHLL